jgi:hypothetical protein
LLAAVLGGCGSSSETNQAPTAKAPAASYPVAGEETARQTLGRARTYFAAMPAKASLLERGIRACSGGDQVDLARRLGATTEPLAMGAAYSQDIADRARREVAALGCYLGAATRQEQLSKSQPPLSGG